MLHIQPHQMRILERPGRERLIDHLCAHLREHRAGGAHLLSPEALRDRVERAVSLARARGLRAHRSIAAYVNLMFLLGPRFDTHPAIQGLIAEKGAAPDGLVDRMLARLTPSEWEQAQGYDRSWDRVGEPERTR
jgi:hypothetical protein